MTIGLLGILILMILVCVGMPVTFALLLVSAGGLIYLVGLDQMLTLSAPMFYNYLANYDFSVIAMFVLMGNIGYHSGLFTEVFDVARKWFGRLPAGLAISVVVAQSVFGACSGSSVAACVVVGKAALPIMRKMRYPEELSTGVIAASGTLAVLIPPSVTICIYGILVDESIGKLLVAGFFPGLLSAVVYIGMIMIQSRHLPRDPEKYGIREKIISLRYLWVVIVLIMALTGGIYFGICTPTEGGAFGAFVMFLLALVTGRVNRDMMLRSLRSTLVTSGMILIIVVGAVLFSRFLTLSGFSHGLADWVTAIELPRIFLFGLVTIIYLFLGCFIGSTGMMVMTLPTFYPLMISLGYDSVWFGIMVIVLCEMAFVTPPVGINLYTTKDLSSDIKLITVIRGVTPFLFRDVLTLAILYAFPQIATFLPGKM